MMAPHLILGPRLRASNWPMNDVLLRAQNKDHEDFWA